MVRHLFQFVILGLLLAVAPAAVVGEVVVLTETPVAAFTLPDGSVLKNAFVWRRNSEGLMIVHDEGQFFLNYKVLPEDWKVAYLGEEAVEQPEEPEAPTLELVDKFKVGSLLQDMPGLSDKGVEWLFRADSDEETKQVLLSMALFQSLASNNREKAKRYFLIIEELGFKIDSVKLDKIFNQCTTCKGKGEYEQDCPACEGNGECVKCEGKGLNKFSVGKTKAECEECEGSGDCPTCDGEKSAVLPCGDCRGRGQLLDRQYCEVNRDVLVQRVNALVGERVTLTQDPAVGIAKVLVTLPDLDSDACDYYLSDEYSGAMNTNILVACVMQYMLKGQMIDADRINHLIEARFPKNKMLKITDYIKICDSCKGTGSVQQPCPTCTDANGKNKGKKKGQCNECEGKGTATKKGLGATGECLSCDGSGECVPCKGTAEVIDRCAECAGSGRSFETMRAEIKLELLVGDLNGYYAMYLKEKEMPIPTESADTPALTD
ncbi:MAG: hypothetical protein V3V05_04985 [Pontiella sp.]